MFTEHKLQLTNHIRCQLRLHPTRYVSCHKKTSQRPTPKKIFSNINKKNNIQQQQKINIFNSKHRAYKDNKKHRQKN